MRVILVPLSGEAHDRAALDAAYRVAQPFRSHIVGMFVRPGPLDELGIFEGIPPEMVDRVTRAAKSSSDTRAKLAKGAFDEARAAADAALADRPTGTDTVTARWHQITGADEEILIGHGRLADLIVFAGLGAPEQEKRLAATLLSGARPILLVPDQGMGTGVSTIVLAWNGSAESTHALAGALPLLLNAEQVHVLTAATPRVQVGSGAALADYLGWHGVVTEVHPLYPDSEVGEALLAQAKDLKADLLVMGGYGRSRFRELVFGGVTRHVLTHHDLPVLIAH